MSLFPRENPSYSSDIHITGLLTSDVLHLSEYIYFHRKDTYGLNLLRDTKDNVKHKL